MSLHALDFQIRSKIRSTLASEHKLLSDLEKFELADLHILLNKDGYPIWREMPGEEHNLVTQKIAIRCGRWKNGRSIEFRSGTVNVFLNNSFNSPKNQKRCPDFAMYGSDRLDGEEIRVLNRKSMSPHVIIQFSWTGDFDKEACAIDDMMNYAGVGEYAHLGRPNVAYLIKALRRGALEVYGFDVFQVEQDKRTLKEPTMKYRCGVQENTTIKITPAFMGLVGDEEDPFELDMVHIRETLERCDIEFVQAEGNEM